MFLQRNAPPVLIDEVQYVPEILDYIKVYVDREKRCGDFWVPCQNFMKMRMWTGSFTMNRIWKPISASDIKDLTRVADELVFLSGWCVYPVEIKKGWTPKDAVKNFSVLVPIEREPLESDVLKTGVLRRGLSEPDNIFCISAD